jgi:hypothetical protein
MQPRPLSEARPRRVVWEKLPLFSDDQDRIAAAKGIAHRLLGLRIGQPLAVGDEKILIVLIMDTIKQRI